jgi:hypothetical protein
MLETVVGTKKETLTNATRRAWLRRKSENQTRMQKLKIPLYAADNANAGKKGTGRWHKALQDAPSTHHL